MTREPATSRDCGKNIIITYLKRAVKQLPRRRFSQSYQKERSLEYGTRIQRIQRIQRI